MTHASRKRAGKRAQPDTPDTKAQQGKGADAVAGKVLPPKGPVQVPTQPSKPGKHTPDEAAQASDPPRDTRDDSSWADGSKPRPNAKHVRTHLF